MKPIAFIAIRTTGPDPDQDEIVEIGAIRVDPSSLEIEDSLSVPVLPEFVGRAVNHESAEAFLAEALERLEPVLRGALLVGHEIDATMAFMRRAWRAHGHEPDGLDERGVEVAWIAWALLDLDSDELTLDVIAERLGLEQPDTASAIGRARCALELLRSVVRRPPCVSLADLSEDERAIARTVLNRLRWGRREYGPWSVNDGRVYPREALLEVLDCMAYCAAELLRLERRDAGRTVVEVPACS